VKYPKILTLYERDENHKVDPSKLSHPAFGLISEWLVTEKINGRNHRVILHPDGEIEHRGRTDKSTFADFELEAAQKAINGALLHATINQDEDGSYPLTILYGELYGPKIQGGDRYTDEISFRLFDVRIGDFWLEWDDIEGLAGGLEIDTVPVMHYDWGQTLPKVQDDLLGLVPFSEVAALEGGNSDIPAEGVVARTDPMLFTRDGMRLMYKLKYKDFS